MKKHITIPRKEPSQDLYTQLQEAALNAVQRYSGNLWTDYNEHDPGVTVMDVLNYTLLETDYRLQFDLQDYLTPAKGKWLPSGNALFSPLEIFPVNPVTEVDYRKLFVSSIDDLKNVWVVLDKKKGIYNFIVDAHPDTLPYRRKEIFDEVHALYSTHRNLCEDMGGIRFLEYDQVLLHADIELDEKTNVNAIMARIYLETQEFLNAGMRFKRVDDLLNAGKTLDEILDGPLQRKMIIDDESIIERKMEFDLFVLHGRLRELPGILRVNSLALEWKGELITSTLRVESPFQTFAVFYSPMEGEQTVILRKKGKNVFAIPERVNRILSNLRTELYGHQNMDTAQDLLGNDLPGTYRNIYSHLPVWNDLPACYKGATQLKEYLDVFDKFMMGVLTELEELPIWMRTEAQRLSNKKEIWMDMLDSLYDVESNPEYLKESEATQENRIRRATFLEMIPRWGYERGRARDLRDFSPESLSGVEVYMKGLFNSDKYGLNIALIEHRLFCLDADSLLGEAFNASAVLSVNDNYLTDSEFRHCCEQVLRSRVPAHIQLQIYWQDKQRLKLFDTDYAFWKYALSTTEKVGLKELTERLKYRLADDNYWYSKV
ncbi:hypothetical protein [Bacteroides sp. 51]|uniref:hypothetical protein n=1 Tax=Bacteroides sp. 51 TaxID=2302938 RepID=UPI0013D5D509|nr:hypothetical protein [Bacteroides sp. 51]NDV82955.1 hypothetical protein [Bacteroides sp. 51]